MSDFRTPLKRARGAGSAREGVGHWWAQRITAIALAPLSIWFVWLTASLTGAEYEVVRAAFAHPINAALTIAFVWSLFHHGQLGLQVVIEDYVHPRSLELTMLVLIRFSAFLAALAATIAVLRLVFAG
jgi:succinate dehydrogenase / fumarate reductase membrane anchor subunit